MANLQNLTINDTGSLSPAVGTTAERPASPVTGGLRYNSTNASGESYTGSTWLATPIPSPILNGMVLELDAANYTHKPGILNSSTWTLGSGGAPGFNQNGNTGENERVFGTDAWGRTSIVWETRCSGDNQADGGWNSDNFSININLMYRFCVWVKRTSATSSGTFYLGTGGTTQCVYALSTNAQECNPYWDCIGTGAFTQNEWNLVVGHQFPANYTLSAGAATTGVWNTAGTKVRNINGCNIGNDCKSGPSTTASLHRTYHYYSSDNTTRLQFAYPRVDIVDGNEPSLNDLLTFNNYRWIDSSNGGNSCFLINVPGYNTSNGGSIVFGTKDYAQVTGSTSTNLSTTMTASCWVYWTGGNGRIFQKDGPPYTRCWEMGVYNGNFRMELWHSNGVGTVLTSNAITLNGWMYLTITFDGTDIKMYQNGSLATTLNFPGDIRTDINTPIFVGGYWPGEYFSGRIAYASLYNRALSAAEVQQNFQSQRLRFGI